MYLPLVGLDKVFDKRLHLLVRQVRGLLGRRREADKLNPHVVPEVECRLGGTFVRVRARQCVAAKADEAGSDDALCARIGEIVQQACKVLDHGAGHRSKDARQRKLILVVIVAPDDTWAQDRSVVASGDGVRALPSRHLLQQRWGGGVCKSVQGHKGRVGVAPQSIRNAVEDRLLLRRAQGG